MESYKEHFDNSDDEETTTQLDFMMMSESSTTSPMVPTLSLNPFVGPYSVVEESTIPVFLKQDEESEKITTALFKEHTDIPTTTPATSINSRSDEIPEIQLSTDLPKIEDTTKILETTEPTISTTSEKIAVKNDKIVDFKKEMSLEVLMKTIENMLTTESAEEMTTIVPSKARELNLSGIPKDIAQSPIKPIVPSSSLEIVKTTPTELVSILATLKEIVAKVESLTTSQAEEMTTTTLKSVESLEVTTVRKEETDVRSSRLTRSVDDNEEIKQKFSTVKGCSFNGKLFKVGETISTVQDECLECNCEYAPIAHCILKEECLLA